MAQTTTGRIQGYYRVEAICALCEEPVGADSGEVLVKAPITGSMVGRAPLILPTGEGDDWEVGIVYSAGYLDLEDWEADDYSSWTIECGSCGSSLAEDEIWPTAQRFWTDGTFMSHGDEVEILSGPGRGKLRCHIVDFDDVSPRVLVEYSIPSEDVEDQWLESDSDWYLPEHLVRVDSHVQLDFTHVETEPPVVDPADPMVSLLRDITAAPRSLGDDGS